MRHIEENRFPHPSAPLLLALGVAGRAEAAGLAGERQQMFTTTVRAADLGEAGARIAAVEIALDDLPDDRPENDRIWPRSCAPGFRSFLFSLRLVGRFSPPVKTGDCS
jgi:hypothetical protein